MSRVHGSEPSGLGCLGRWRQLSHYLRLALVAGCFLFALLVFQFSELLHVGNPLSLKHLSHDTTTTEPSAHTPPAILEEVEEEASTTTPLPPARTQHEESLEPEVISTPIPAPAHTAEPEPDHEAVRTSRLHYLLPATDSNELFCIVVTSLLLNRYPVPYIVGWRGEGKFDAKAAHVAKLRSIQRYLTTLPHGGHDDDLVMVGDGHDVMAQLPVEVMVERYFQLMADADVRLADRFGISVEEAHQRGLRQTLLWGADKMCWPALYEELQCTRAVIPPSTLPRGGLGPKTDNGDHTYAHPLFLNSGSVIGPLGDMRDFFDAAVAEMESTYDPEFKYKDSDQIYIARLFGRQEASRAERIAAEEAVPRGNGTKSAPEFEEEDNKKNVTEHHITLDYESAFVQTGCYSHGWMRKLHYNSSDHTATMAEDRLSQGKNFKPYPIQMPANVYQSLVRIFHSLFRGQKQPSMSAREWVGSLALDTNIVSKHIFNFYHATCSKRDLAADFTKYWFYPFVKPLLRAAFRETRTGQPMAEKLIDGRRWVYQKSYPEKGGVREDQLGGVFTDFGHDDEFIPYTTLCKEHLDILER